MKVLIVEGSTRSPASTMAHVEALVAAQPADVECEIAALKDLDLPLFEDHRTTQDWPHSDALETLYSRMQRADLLLLATPLYWYSVSHLMKNFLDHWSYFLRHATAPMSDAFRDKDFGLIVVGSAVDGRNLREPVFETLRLSVDYIKARCIGGFYGVGLRDGKGHPDSMAAIAGLSLRDWREQGSTGSADQDWFGYASPS